MKALLTILLLVGCTVPDYCKLTPKQPVIIQVVPNLEIAGVPVYGHWEESQRLIRVRPDAYHSIPHELLHAGMSDHGIPSKDHHKLMEDCPV